MGRDVDLRGHLCSGPQIGIGKAHFPSGHLRLRWYPVQPNTLDPWAGPWGRGYQEKWPVTGGGGGRPQESKQCQPLMSGNQAWGRGPGEGPQPSLILTAGGAGGASGRV